MPPQRYWLVKSEPDCFSIHDLARSPKQTTFWDGVRNYQARNFICEMKLGDGVLFYHSSTDPNAIVGAAEVVREAYPDHTAFDPKCDHYDPKSTTANPTWFMVDIQLTRTFQRPLTLSELRSAKPLAKMELLRQGSRLSVQPVTAKEWKTVLQIADQRPASTENALRANQVSRKGAKTAKKTK
jgi:predicted RNA-binding protein with PUA-like domain